LMPGMRINETAPDPFGGNINGCTDPKVIQHGLFLL
jgi:hypothetical protein